MAYSDALALQERLVARKLSDRSESDYLLLLEHDPVFTIGRTQDQSSLRDAAALPFPVHITNRGGQGTYHGPGQLVGYPILDLTLRGQDLHRYLRALEDVVIATCGQFGVAAAREDGRTGVWVGKRKIASIGVGVRKWVTMHGFALNVCGPLTGFGHITPCGIVGVEMTDLTREGATSVTVEVVAQALQTSFFGWLETALPMAPASSVMT